MASVLAEVVRSGFVEGRHYGSVVVLDAGGAVVLTRADRAKDCAKPPVYVRGCGEATEHVMGTQMDNLAVSAATRLAGCATTSNGRPDGSPWRPAWAGVTRRATAT